MQVQGVLVYFLVLLGKAADSTDSKLSASSFVGQSSSSSESMICESCWAKISKEDSSVVKTRAKRRPLSLET